MVLFLARAKVFLFSIEYRLALGPTLPPILWYMMKHNNAQTTAVEDLYTTPDKTNTMLTVEGCFVTALLYPSWNPCPITATR